MAEPVDQPMDAPFDETAPLEIPEHAAEEPEAADTGLHVAEPEDSPFVAPMERPVDEPAEDLYGDTAEWPVAAPADEPADEPVAEQSIPPAQRIENAAADQSLWASYTDEMPEVTEPPRMSPLFALVRVFALPRSTFRQVAEDDVTVWPAALALRRARRTDQGRRRARLRAPRVGAVRAPRRRRRPLRGRTALPGRLRRGVRRRDAARPAAWAGRCPLPAEPAVGGLSRARADRPARPAPGRLHGGCGSRCSCTRGCRRWSRRPTDPALGRVVYALLGGIDAFTLWAFVLLVLRRVVTGGRGRMRRAVAAILVTALCALVAAVPTLFIAGLLGG